MTRPFLAAVLLFASAAAPAGAKTIHVPGDYPEIQMGINHAVDGDTVLVAPGTYVEQIAFLGKAITVTSSHGAESTVINARRPPYHYGSVVYMTGGEENDSILCGFTLTGGTGTLIGYYTYGGAVYCQGSSPVIRECIITQNEAHKGYGYGFGAGIYCDGENPVIEQNVISKNDCNYGGGIHCEGSHALIQGNTVFKNIAESGGGHQLYGGSCRHPGQRNLLEPCHIHPPDRRRWDQLRRFLPGHHRQPHRGQHSVGIFVLRIRRRAVARRIHERHGHQQHHPWKPRPVDRWRHLPGTLVRSARRLERLLLLDEQHHLSEHGGL